jgi:hypothetical protein
MIADIGLMVGVYILTRMTDLFSQQTNAFAKFMAGVTMLITVLCLVGLFMTSSQMSSLPHLGQP